MKPTRRSCLSGITRKLMLLFCALFLSGISAFASHLMYGNISWKPVSTGPNGTVVEFTVTEAFDLDAVPQTIVVNGVYNDQTFLVTGVGNGNSAKPLHFVVKSISPDGYFVGEAKVTETYPVAPAAYLAYTEDAARWTELENNANLPYRIETVVNLTPVTTPATTPMLNQSPTTTTPVIVTMAAGQTAATYQIPTADANGGTRTYSLTPNGQFGAGTQQPEGLTISSSGLLTFQTAGKTPDQFYNTSVTVTEPAAQGGKVMIDFIIKIGPANNTCNICFYQNICNPTCNGAANGSINLTLTNASYATYKWYKNNSTTPFATTQDVSCLTAGTYTVVVTKSGCVATQTYVLTEPTKINTSAVVTNPTCSNACNGSINLTVTGGTPPYCYSWNTGSVAQDLYNKSEGRYIVTVTDVRGCMVKDTFYLTAPPALVAGSITPSFIYAPGTGSCSPYTIYKGYNASPQSMTLSVSPTGGTPPYSFQWTPSATVATPNAAATVVTPSCTTVYDVTVTDSKGCTSTGYSCASILNYITGGFTVKVKDVRCGTNNDKVEMCVENPCPSTCTNNYHNHHNSNCSSNCSNYNHTCNNSYCTNTNHYHGSNTVCVTQAQAQQLIAQGNCLGDCYSGWWSWWTRKAQDPNANKEVNDFISVYPSPAHGTISLTLKSTGGAYHSYRIINMSGQVVAAQHFEFSIMTGTETIDISSLAAGVYIMHVENEKGTSQTRFVVQ